MVKCPNCSRSVPAVRNAAGITVALPHMAKGGERVFGFTCGVKR